MLLPLPDALCTIAMYTSPAESTAMDVTDGYLLLAADCTVSVDQVPETYDV